MGSLKAEDMEARFRLMKIAPHDQLQYAYNAKREGCSDQIAAQRAEIPYWQLRIMLKLGEMGHPTWEPVYLTFKRKAGEFIGEIEIADGANALDSPGASRDRVLMREAAEVYEPIIHHGGGGAGLPSGFNINVAQFAAEPQGALVESGVVKQIPEDVDEVVDDNKP